MIPLPNPPRWTPPPALLVVIYSGLIFMVVFSWTTLLIFIMSLTLYLFSNRTPR